MRFPDDGVTGLRDPAARRRRRARGGRRRRSRSPRRASSTLGFGVFNQRPRRSSRSSASRSSRAPNFACDDGAPRSALARASRVRSLHARAASRAAGVDDDARDSRHRPWHAGRRARAAVRRRPAAAAHRHARSLRPAPGRRGVRDRARRRRLVGRPRSSPTAPPRSRSASTAACRRRRSRTAATTCGRGAASSTSAGKATSICRAERGRVELAIALERAWTPHGTLAADLHVHAHASNDSTRAEPAARGRAGRRRHPGHRAVRSQRERRPRSPRSRALGLDDRVASIASNELTAEPLHVGVYPVPVDRDQPAAAARRPTSSSHATPQQLFDDRARAFPAIRSSRSTTRGFASPRCTTAPAGTASRGRRRSRSTSTRSRCSPATARSTSPGDRRFDDSVRDFYTLIDHGHLDRAARQQRHPRPQLGARRHRRATTCSSTIRARSRSTRPASSPRSARAASSRRAGRGSTSRSPRSRARRRPSGPARRSRPTPARCGSTSRSSQARWVPRRSHPHHGRRARRPRARADDRRARRACARSTGPGAIEVGAADTWIGVTADGDTPLPLELTGTYQQRQVEPRRRHAVRDRVADPRSMPTATAAGSAATPTSRSADTMIQRRWSRSSRAGASRSRCARSSCSCSSPAGCTSIASSRGSRR